MTWLFFHRKPTIWIFQICKIWSPKWSPWATILYWLKKVQLQFCSNFEGIFGCRTSGAPKKAPFMYVEICPWVILFNSKLENEVLDDFQTYRLEKHGFFRFQGSPTRYGEFWGLQFGLQSPQNITFINFRKIENFSILSCMLKMHQFLRATPNSEMVLDSLLSASSLVWKLSEITWASSSTQRSEEHTSELQSR